MPEDSDVMRYSYVDSALTVVFCTAHLLLHTTTYFSGRQCLAESPPGHSRMQSSLDISLISLCKAFLGPARCFTA
jgi:hypothetical protein